MRDRPQTVQSEWHICPLFRHNSKPFLGKAIGQQLHIDMKNDRFRPPLRRQPLFAPDQNGTLPTTPNPGQHLDHRPPHPIHDPLLIKKGREIIILSFTIDNMLL